MKKSSIQLPDSNWEWENEGKWDIEVTRNTDPEGWTYGNNFGDENFVKESNKVLNIVRKRVWVKTCSRLAYHEE